MIMVQALLLFDTNWFNLFDSTFCLAFQWDTIATVAVKQPLPTWMDISNTFIENLDDTESQDGAVRIINEVCMHCTDVESGIKRVNWINTMSADESTTSYPAILLFI